MFRYDSNFLTFIVQCFTFHVQGGTASSCGNLYIRSTICIAALQEADMAELILEIG